MDHHDISSIMRRLDAFEAHVSHRMEKIMSAIDDLKAALALGLTLPSVDLSVSLEAQISILAAFVASLQALIALGAGSAGIDVFTYDGTVAGLGPALTGELATGAPSGGLPTDHADALVMMTRVSSTWTAMVDFFGGL